MALAGLHERILRFLLERFPIPIAGNPVARGVRKRRQRVRRAGPFFAALGPAAIADVTNMLRTMDLPPRTMIIRKGQQGDCMYFIAAGEVEVDLPGKKVTLGDGAFFGEMALLGNNLRSANITTTRVSRLLVLDLVDFRLLMARHPDLAETIDAEARRRELENE